MSHGGLSDHPVKSSTKQRRGRQPVSFKRQPSQNMASVLRATTDISRDKGKGKSRANGNDAVEKPTTKPRKDKVLLISSRGVTQRMRHLMNDLEALLPHTKKGMSFSPCRHVFTHIDITLVYKSRNTVRLVFPKVSSLISNRQTPSSTANLPFTFLTSSPTSTPAPTPSTLKHVGTKTYISGYRARPMDRVSSVTCRMCTRWTSSR